MQKIMSLVAVGFAEIFSIKFFNLAVLVALTERRFLVGGVNSLGANGLNVNIVEYFCGLDRLTAARYATAGAAHDFDKHYVVEFAGFELFHNGMSVFDTVSDKNLSRFSTEFYLCLLDALRTANSRKVKFFER